MVTALQCASSGLLGLSNFHLLAEAVALSRGRGEKHPLDSCEESQ